MAQPFWLWVKGKANAATSCYHCASVFWGEDEFRGKKMGASKNKWKSKKWEIKKMKERNEAPSCAPTTSFLWRQQKHRWVISHRKGAYYMCKVEAAFPAFNYSITIWTYYLCPVGDIHWNVLPRWLLFPVSARWPHTQHWGSNELRSPVRNDWGSF